MRSVDPAVHLLARHFCSRDLPAALIQFRDVWFDRLAGDLQMALEHWHVDAEIAAAGCSVPTLIDQLKASLVDQATKAKP